MTRDREYLLDILVEVFQMKNKKLVLMAILLLVVFLVGGGLFVIVYRSNTEKREQEARAEQIIHSFMEAQGIDIQPGTEDYTIFMREIVWNEYPELTGKDSDFVKDQDELDCVLDYAWNHSGYKELYGDYNESDAEEAKPSSTEPSK